MIHHTQELKQKKPIPICTINFSNFHDHSQSNLTVYDNYMHQKLGYYNEETVPMLTQLTSFHKPKVSEVIIMDNK